MKKISTVRIEETRKMAESHNNASSYFVLPFLRELEELEISNKWQRTFVKKDLRVSLYNAQRGKYLDGVVEYYNNHPTLKNTDIIFFNELDYGMARTGNINTTKFLADKLKMNYVYGVEFLELTKGEKEEKSASGENEESYHGNAILSKYPLKDVDIVRLPEIYDWYYDTLFGGQFRFGGRMALFATVTLNEKEIGLVCTHLENTCGPIGRLGQMKFILNEIDKRYKNTPVIIGGDMNTITYFDSNEEQAIYARENYDLLKPETYEPLLQCVENNGFDYKNSNKESKITCYEEINGEVADFNLDWFFTKGLKCKNPDCIKSLFSTEHIQNENLKYLEGVQLSDHNVLSLELEI